eukprot:1159810-Pelagomonas_calceolata.AAC.6
MPLSSCDSQDLPLQCLLSSLESRLGFYSIFFELGCLVTVREDQQEAANHPSHAKEGSGSVRCSRPTQSR